MPQVPEHGNVVFGLADRFAAASVRQNQRDVMAVLFLVWVTLKVEEPLVSS